jgi:hypothetical protein
MFVCQIVAVGYTAVGYTAVGYTAVGYTEVGYSAIWYLSWLPKNSANEIFLNLLAFLKESTFVRTCWNGHLQIVTLSTQ